MKKALFTMAIGAFVLLLAPMGAYAYEVSVDSITYTGSADLDSDGVADALTVADTPSMPPEAGITEDTFGVSYADSLVGTTMTGVFTVSDYSYAPMLLISGGIIDSYTWDSTASQATVVWTADQFMIPGQTTESSESAFVFIDPVADPTPESPDTVGPPASMAGGYIYCDINDWEIYPPSGPEEMGFGLTLNGPAGETGYFGIYMPSTMFDLMSTMSGEEVTAEDMALFIDDYQANINNTLTDDGGIIFDINITFTGSTATSLSSSAMSSSTVSKTAFAKEAAPLSAALKKKSQLKGKTAKLYGWYKDKEAGTELKLYRKKLGTKGYKLIEKASDLETLNDNGYYYRKVKPSKKGVYYFKVKNKNGKTISDRVRLRVY